MAQSVLALDLDTPALVVDLDIMERNLDRMAEAARKAGVGLRPHTKTHKSPVIARMQLERGATGIAVAKLGEAEVMVDAGITDTEILVAYPILGEAKLERLAELCRRANIILAVDSVEVGEGLARVGRELGRRLPVFIEVDTGLHRMGLEPGEATIRLGQDLGRLGGLEVRGVMSHAGHVSRAETPEEVVRVAHEDAEALVRTADALRQAGLDIRVVAPGSTPTALPSLDVPGVTEIRPGTYVFGDVNSVARWAMGIEDCAATVLTTVVSRPASDRAIIDAGSKVLSSDPSVSPEFPGFGYVRHAARVPEVRDSRLILERLSEEHGIIRLKEPGPSPRVGEKLAVIPNHVCPAVNLADALQGVRGGRVETIIPVAARGKAT